MVDSITSQPSKNSGACEHSGNADAGAAPDPIRAASAFVATSAGVGFGWAPSVGSTCQVDDGSLKGTRQVAGKFILATRHTQWPRTSAEVQSEIA